jgi:predicted dehydrogenase
VTIRVGLLGTGYWAVHTQGAALAERPDVDFAGVWGRDPAKAEAVAADFGVPAFADVDDLLAKVDAVSIALPPDVQADLAVRAAEAGRHLLLDKPLALTTAAADRVVAAVEAAGVASIIFFTRRFHSNVDAFVAEAGARAWDGARVTMFASIFQPGNPYGASPWRRERGGLWDIGPHALSVVLPVLGPVAEVVALAGPHDATYALLRHASGALSTLALTLDAPPAGVVHEIVLYGPEGQVPVPRGDETAVAAFGTAVGQLVANVAAGVTAHPCDVRFGRDVVAVLDQVERARR